MRNPHVPDGGVDGDVLTLDTSVAGEVVWATPSGGGGGAPTGAQYLVLVTDATLTAERRLLLGTGLTGADGGAGGDYTISLDSDLVALAGLSTTGIAVRTGAGTWTTRSLVQPAAGLTIADAGGVSGAPTFALADDLAAVEALNTTGLAVRTGTSAWTTRTIVSGDDVLVVSNGDGVSGNPTISASGTVAELTTTGAITSYALPDCQFVEIMIVSPGGKGNVGVTGDNTASRAGGRGGGAGGVTTVTFRREQLPDTIYYYVAPGGTVANAGSKSSAVFFADPGSFTDTSPTSTSYAYLIGYALGGSGGQAGGGGGAVVNQANALGHRLAMAFVSTAGQDAATPAASGLPTALRPFGATGSTAALTSAGCSGAGKSTVAGGTAAAGGGYAAEGPFSAVAGGAIATNGTAGHYGGGGASWTASSSAPAEMAWSYGGTGGGSNTAGAGGNGGAGGGYGSGGGGGGAGTTAGGTGGDGADGVIIIRCW